MWNRKKIAGIPIILGAIAWFFRGTIEDIFFNWVSDKVIVFFKEKGMTYFLNLSFEYGIPVVFFAIGLSLLIFGPGKKESKSDQGKSPNLPPVKVERDVWLLNAVHYIAYKSWDLIDAPLDGTHLNLGNQALSAIRQKAFDGELPIWGKIGRGTLYKSIAKEYWEHYGFEVLSFAGDDPEEFCTEKYIDIARDEGIFKSLMTSKDKVEELWPLSNAMGNSLPLTQHNYENCVIYQYPDGVKKSEPKNVISEKDKPTFILFNPSSSAILEDNNINCLTDNGTGDYTIHFYEDVEGRYNVQVLADANYKYEIKNKTKNGFKILFPTEPDEVIKLVVNKDN